MCMYSLNNVRIELPKKKKKKWKSIKFRFQTAHRVIIQLFGRSLSPDLMIRRRRSRLSTQIPLLPRILILSSIYQEYIGNVFVFFFGPIFFSRRYIQRKQLELNSSSSCYRLCKVLGIFFPNRLVILLLLLLFVGGGGCCGGGDEYRIVYYIMN